jgi:hypothetical protein
MSERAPGGPPRNPEIAFEREDIRATPVLRFLVGIAVTTTVVCFLLLAFYRGMRSYVAGLQPPPPHMKFEADRQPEGPKLLTQEPEDLAKFMDAQRTLLSSYAWVDKEHGVVRIPVEEAMKLVAERGVAAAPPPGAGN